MSVVERNKMGICGTCQLSSMKMSAPLVALRMFSYIRIRTCVSGLS
jgi:hypothetical protein